MQPTPFKLGTFSIAGCRPFAGLVLDNRVIALSALRTFGGASSLRLGETILEVLAQWESNFAALQDIVFEMINGRSPELQRHSCALDQVHVHAPIPEPRTLYCSGANYKKHVVDLIIAHQDQAATLGMALETKRAWGMKLMDEMWRRVRENDLPHKGINFWVYDSAAHMFTGVELEDSSAVEGRAQASAPAS